MNTFQSRVDTHGYNREVSSLFAVVITTNGSQHSLKTLALALILGSVGSPTWVTASRQKDIKPKGERYLFGEARV